MRKIPTQSSENIRKIGILLCSTDSIRHEWVVEGEALKCLDSSYAGGTQTHTHAQTHTHTDDECVNTASSSFY